MTGRREPVTAAGAWNTLVRGFKLSPELRRGLGVTLLLAMIATGGKVVVPVALQVTFDRGLLTPAGVQPDVIIRYCLAAVAVLAGAAVAGYFMNRRLVEATETALSNLRVRTFRHIHDLSQAHHDAEHRGSLVSRVTADVDTISRFMQWGGILLVVNLGQLVLATAVMAVYSWQLTLVVVVTIAPLVAVLRWFQQRLSVAYDLVRARVGDMLTAVSESVMGAAVIRAYGIEDRTNRRVRTTVDRYFEAQYRAGRLSAFMFSSGEVFAAVALAAALALGVVLGTGGQVTEGQLVAFMFLITLFVGPVQVATEVLDQAQTAIAGWRRVLDVLDTPADVADPALRADGGRDIPPGPLGVRFEGVRFAYPVRGRPHERGPAVLRDVSVTIAPQSRVAVVGETGSGKSTFAKLLTRLADPTQGTIRLNGAALSDVRFDSLRERVIMVPQDDVLFDTTILGNARLARADLSREQAQLAFTELGLRDWLDALPEGLDTPVGERGEHLSVGERQLVALARAYVANPDLLVLDEATSAVDPATEVRLQRALEGLTRGRTALAIAHRLSTAEAADEVLVFDQGRLVQRGHHRDLVARPGVYRDLHASWSARQTAPAQVGAQAHVAR